MNLEMPMAALSTSAQFNTCHTYPSRSQREKYTDTYTHTHRVPLVCLCFCLWAFVPNQAPGIFWESRLHQWGPLDCHMSGCRPIPITLSWSKAKESTILELPSRICIPVAYYIHTQNHSMQPYEYPCVHHIYQKAFFFFLPLFSVRIEIRRTLNWTLSL